MFFEHRTFWLSKDAQDPSGYEDAFQVDPGQGKAAVCDGVSSSLFSGRWAATLAQAAVFDTPNMGTPADLDAWLARQRSAWSASVDENQLAWHQKPKLLEGAGSTLLWVELSGQDAADGTPRPRRLRCYAIGDCCLFHIRGGQVLLTFPIQESARFEDHPRVIRSIYKRSETVAFEAIETQCHPGDLLVLCTDAVACWTLRQIESGVQVDWDAYWQVSQEDWQQWLIQLRQEKQIRYDDSTVVLLRIAGKAPAGRREPSVAESLLDRAETSARGAFDSLKGGLRKGLKGLADSKWLNDSQRR